MPTPMTCPVVLNIYETGSESRDQSTRLCFGGDDGLDLLPVATAISSVFTDPIKAIKVLVMTPETPNPLGTIAIHKNHSGVCTVNWVIASDEMTARRAINQVIHQYLPVDRI